MQISKTLNLVVPFYQDGIEVFAHSTPVSFDVFSRYHSVLSDAFSRATRDGRSMLSAAATASLNLKDAADAAGVWEGQGGVKQGFIGEIHRITNVVLPAESGGWEPVLMYDAIKQKRIDSEAVFQIENAVVFFTFVCWLFQVGNPQTRKLSLTESVGLQTSALDCMAFCSSLPTLTKEDDSTQIPG